MPQDILEMLQNENKRYSVYEETYGHMRKLIGGLTQRAAKRFVDLQVASHPATNFEVKEDR